MMFFKSLRHDLKNGIFVPWRVFLMLFFVILFACVDLLLNCRSDAMTEALIPTFTDYVFYVFAGKTKFVPMPGVYFDFPALWTLFLALCFYLTLQYPLHELAGVGKNILLRTKSRSGWYASKCVWVICCVALIFCMLFGVIALFTLLTGGSFTDTVSARVAQIAAVDALFTTLDTPDFGRYLLLPPLMLIALSLWQLALSLLLRPAVSFLLSIAELLAAAFYMNRFIPGNYMMYLRTEPFETGGMNLLAGCLLALALALSAVIAGVLLFRRYDILPKE